MARNTNIHQLLFPVKLKPVYVEGSQIPIKGYKAVVGTFNADSKSLEEEQVISIVTNNYMLISNEEALKMAKDIHHKLFPKGSSESFEIFNIKASKTLGSCHIDIIDKDYTLNIMLREVYVPFVRIQNSYNKTMPLSFMVGFCRKVCDNGVIFEENTISINLQHTKSHFRSFDFNKINTNLLKDFERDFITKTNRAASINIPAKLFTPLAMKALNLQFKTDNKNEKIMEKELDRLEHFIQTIGNYTDRYVRKENFGETAYAFFNVITDYASNFPHLQARSMHSMQGRCGNWLTEFCDKHYKKTIDWEIELPDYKFKSTKKQ